jgi:acyl-CoA reductase-like NAD-dependent aldehyde dehydrogenase
VSTTATRGIWIDGEERLGRSEQLFTITNPYDDSLVGRVACASSEDVEQAVGSAVSASRGHMRSMPAHERAAILRRAAAGIRAGAEELVATVVAEGGKPIRDARREIGRAAGLFELAADHVTTLEGQVVPMDVVESGVNRFGYAIRVPVGVVAAITPSNSPVNLSTNKIAPALAAGNAVVLKPADQTPLSALRLAQILTEAGLPPGALNVVIGTVEEVAQPLVRDDRVRMVTVTGGVETGRAITREAGIKKLALELGSSAANIVCADADVPAAAKSLATSAFLSSGQACISAQRIYVHESVAEEFIQRLVSAAEAMVIGDPADPATEIGPMISTTQVDRLMGWIDEARGLGATVLTGGERVQRTIRPTVLTGVPKTAQLGCQEAFGPVATLTTFTTIDEAIELANASQYGLQAGVFTRDITTMFRMAREIDVGALWVNDSSRYRQDNYPFGGMKLSGLGREGVRYAIEDMTELKFVGVRLGPSAGIL